MKISDLIKERDEALLSLDKKKILAYAEKYNVPLPSNDLSLWAGIHKARLHISNLAEKEKEASRQWLKEHGFSERL